MWITVSIWLKNGSDASEINIGSNIPIEIITKIFTSPIIFKFRFDGSEQSFFINWIEKTIVAIIFRRPGKEIKNWFHIESVKFIGK